MDNTNAFFLYSLAAIVSSFLHLFVVSKINYKAYTVFNNFILNLFYVCYYLGYIVLAVYLDLYNIDLIYFPFLFISIFSFLCLSYPFENNRIRNLINRQRILVIFNFILFYFKTKYSLDTGIFTFIISIMLCFSLTYFPLYKNEELSTLKSEEI